MQAVFLLMMFSFFVSVVTGYVTRGELGSAMFQQQRVAQTKTTFEDIRRIVLTDLVPANLITPAATNNPARWVCAQPELRAVARCLYNGTFDEMRDEFNLPVNGVLISETRILAAGGGVQISAPVMGVAFISGGPNRQVESALATQLATVRSNRTISGFSGLVVPPGSDDLLISFTDESAVRQQWQLIKGRVDRIAAQVLRRYQSDFSAYRDRLMAQYEARIAAGQTIDLATIMAADPNRPRLLDLSQPAVRQQAGIDEDLTALARQGFAITSSGDASGQNLTVRLQNGSPPSPWGQGVSNFGYIVQLRGATP